MKEKKTILILGSDGMLGKELKEYFSSFSYNVAGWDREELDITDKERVNFKIGELKPDIIINCAAYTNVDKAEEEEDLVTKINGYAAGYIAESARNCGARLIHISTDYVFDGREKGGYMEDFNERKPLNVYGRSKLLGENLIGEEIKKGLSGYAVRVSYLFGKHGKNLVATMAKSVLEKDYLKVVFDQTGTLTYAKDLAGNLRFIIENNLETGIYHSANSSSFSCPELTKEIAKILNRNIKIDKMGYKDYPAKTLRPMNSILINSKLPKLRSWREAVRDFLLNDFNR